MRCSRNDAPLIDLFKHRLGAFLLELTQFQKPFDELVRPDRFPGMKYMMEENPTRKILRPYVAGTKEGLLAASSTFMSFIGPPSEVPVLGSQHVCSAFGIRWFVVAPKQTDVHSCRSFVPAWAVPARASSASGGIFKEHGERDDAGKEEPVWVRAPGVHMPISAISFHVPVLHDSSDRDGQVEHLSSGVAE